MYPLVRELAVDDPHDRALQDLIGELSTQSKTLRRLWRAHDVRPHGTGIKRFHHPAVDEVSLAHSGAHQRRVLVDDGVSSRSRRTVRSEISLHAV